MKTIEEVNADIKDLNKEIKELNKEKLHLQDIAKKEAFWQRIIDEKWSVSVSDESQEKADQGKYYQTSFPRLAKYDYESKYPFKVGALRFRFCSTKQPYNVRQPHDGGPMPVEGDTRVTVWNKEDIAITENSSLIGWTSKHNPILSYMIHPKGDE